MPRYLIRDRQTEAVFELEAWCAEAAFDRLGWNPDAGVFDCYVFPSTEPPKDNEKPLRLGSA